MATEKGFMKTGNCQGKVMVFVFYVGRAGTRYAS